MSEKNFLNIHVIISHNPSCLNRDDMNMQKSAIFGGVRRVRVSSQCLKRAIRKSEYYLNNLGEPSVRTRDLNRLKEIYARQLKDSFSPDFVSEVIDRIAGAGKFNKKDKDNDKGEEDSDDKDTKGKQAVAPWSIMEVERICKVIQQAQAQGEDLDEKSLKKLLEKESGPLLKAMSNSIDIALSGRMATSGLMSSIDGALALSHAITTHAVDADIDWFTAIDDLVVDEGEVGAGHLNTQEFSAGVFYRYASLNIRQLAANMGGATRPEALVVAAHLVHLLSTVVPTAKQNSFAAFNPADMVMTSFSDMPLSAANAFEQPVERDRKKGGYLIPSIKAFEDYMDRVYTGFGLDDRKAAFSLWNTALEPKKATLEELKKWVMNDGV
ncbi:MAG: type I-E CRISPR-associated protein Cas7/Cse4/CasC [bacterium]